MSKELYNDIFSENDALIEDMFNYPEKYNIKDDDTKELIEKSYKQGERRQERWIRRGYSNFEVEEISTKLIDNPIVYINDTVIAYIHKGEKQIKTRIKEKGIKGKKEEVKKTINDIIKETNHSTRIFVSPDILEPFEYKNELSNVV